MAKMFSYNIKEKCFHIIRNTYRNVNSCVHANGNSSAFSPVISG